jgi:Invasin, domain 3
VTSTRNLSGVAATRRLSLLALAVAVVATASLVLAPHAVAATPVRIQLALSPSDIAADGNSTTTATVTLTDATGAGVPGEGVFVTVTSSDPGDVIDPTIADHGDGTYTTTITSSTTPGSVTITAGDTFDGLPSAIAQLIQHGPSARIAVNVFRRRSPLMAFRLAR